MITPSFIDRRSPHPLYGLMIMYPRPDDILIRDGQDANTPQTAATIGRQLKIVADACSRNGKINLAHGGNEFLLGMAKEYGSALVLGGTDVGFLVGGPKSASQKIAAFYGRNAPG